MSPFGETQTIIKPSLWTRACAWQVPLVFVLCLIAGLGAVAWRANLQVNVARSFARTDAKAFTAVVELQLNQAVTAAETLGSLAKQGNGGFSNFQIVATKLLAAQPGLASLQLEPGGVVNDIVPRAGHERMLGINVLKDAGQGTAANEAIAKRVVTVAGPVMSDHGALSIVARQPVFQRTPNGRDSFWGFVAATMRLQEALSRAHMDDLVRKGYNAAFFAPASGQQKAVGIALHGLKSLRDSVQEPVRVQDLTFRLAMRPRDGWINNTKVALDSAAVLLLSAFIALSVKLLASRHAVEAELQATTQQLVREAADRTQAQADYRAAKETLETTQSDLQQNQLALQKLESELAGVQAKLKDDILARDEAVRSKQAELQEAHASLRKAQDTVAQLQAQLEAAGQAKDAASAAREGLERDQSRIAELQLRLEAAIRASRQTAEASAARLAQLEQSNRELTAQLVVAERAEASRPHADNAGGSATAAKNSTDESSAGESKTLAAPQPGVEGASAKTQESKQDVNPSEPHTSAAPDPAATPAARASRKHDSASQPAPRAEAPVGGVAPPGPAATREAKKSSRRKNARRDDQLNLFGNEASPLPAAKPLDTGGDELQDGQGTIAESPEAPEAAPARHLPAAPPVDPAQLRKALGQIVPLLAERDPGARDCLRDNRKTFRSAFSPEAYVEFEQLVKQGDADIALEHLKKAVRKHGISA